MRSVVRLCCLCIAVTAALGARAEERDRAPRHQVEVPHSPDPSAGRWLRNLARGESLVRTDDGDGRAPSYALRGSGLVRLRASETRVSSDQPLAALVLSPDLDVSALSFPDELPVASDPSRHSWSLDLVAATLEPEAVLASGESADLGLGRTLDLEGWEPASLVVATSLLDADSSVEARLLDSSNTVLRSWSVTASTPWSYAVSLAGMTPATLSSCRIEVRVTAGRAVSAVSGGAPTEGGSYVPLLSTRSALVQSGGSSAYSARFSNGVQPFTFRVWGAPSNVCGNIYTIRNGGMTIAWSWICTDSAGAATKGPWTCSQDQTDEPSYIVWPDGSRTSSSTHVCDVTPPTVSVDAHRPFDRTFTGHAADSRWGTGFGAPQIGFGGTWGKVQASFRNDTTGRYWSQASGCYCSLAPELLGAAFDSSPAGWSTGWTVTSPPPASHVSGHFYTWTATSYDYYFPSVRASTWFLQP